MRVSPFPSPRGSSPLTRGKRTRQGAHWGEERLIPAHAGKTGALMIPVRSLWAHPRSRGENHIMCLAMQDVIGSSPLTRGKREQGAQVLHRDGLIPAHAGKTMSPIS